MDKNTSLGAIAGVGLVLAIAFVFALFPAESDDTIILVNKNGNDPVNSCAPGNGLILAQNLTDLCDVVIVSPSTSQLLRYNGTYWINVNPSVVFNDTTTCNNIGTGSAFVCVEGSNVNLRSLLASTGISVSNNSNTITLTNTLPESTVCTNLGSSSSLSEGIYASGNCDFKRLLEGTSISLSSNSTHITITNTDPDNTVCANVGTGTVIYKDGECNFKTLVGSADISITNTTNTVVIDFNGTGAYNRMFMSQTFANIASGQTIYIMPIGSNGNAHTTVEANRQVIIPDTVVVKSFYAQCLTNTLNQNMVIHARLNGANFSPDITVTITAGSTSSVSTTGNSGTITAGDLVSIQAIISAGTGGANNCSFGWMVSNQ